MFSDFKNSFFKNTFLSKLDFIGNTTTLNVNGEKLFKTTLGGILSFIICVLTVITGFYFSQEVWKKAKPNVNRSIISTPSPANLNFGENWEFFFGLQFNNTLYRDNSIYTIKGRLFKFIEGEGLKLQEYKIEPCTKDSFHSKNVDNFLQYNINGTWCLSKDNIPDLRLSNVWGKPGFSFMDISLWPCKNTTSASICKPQDEIEKRLNIGVFSIYTMYSIVLTTDYNSPYKTAIYNDFLPVSYKSFTHSILYLFHSEIYSDVGFLLEDIKVVNSHGIDRLKINFYTQPEADNRFMRFQFQLTNWKEIYNRNYIKLQDIAAQIGGIINVFYIGSLILNYFISNFLFKQYLVDRYYGFNEVINEFFVKKNTINLDSNNLKVNNNSDNDNNDKDFFNSDNDENNEDIDESNSNKAHKNLLNDFGENLKKPENEKILEMSFTPLKNNFMSKTMKLTYKKINSEPPKDVSIDKFKSTTNEIKTLKLNSKSENKVIKTEDLAKELSNIFNRNFINVELPVDISIVKNDKFKNDILKSSIKYLFCIFDEENTINRINNHYKELYQYTSIENIIELSHNMKILKKMLLTEYETYIFESFSGKLSINNDPNLNINIGNFGSFGKNNNLNIEFSDDILNAKFKKDEGLLLEEKNTHNSLIKLVKNIK